MNESNLIYDGLQLMLIGMSMVFVFLSILVFCTAAMKRFLAEDAPLKAGSDSSSPSAEEVAAISSAIHSYRQQSNNSKNSKEQS